MLGGVWAGLEYSGKGTASTILSEVCSRLAIALDISSLELPWKVCSPSFRLCFVFVFDSPLLG